MAEERISVRQWQEKFRSGAFSSHNCAVQCEAGWYDWFCGDIDSLQSAYRKRLGQRLMSSIRDECGKRELFSAGNEYVVVECCNDPRKLKAIQRRLHSNINGLDASTKKVRGRIHFLERFSPAKKRGGTSNGEQ